MLRAAVSGCRQVIESSHAFLSVFGSGVLFLI